MFTRATGYWPTAICSEGLHTLEGLLNTVIALSNETKRSTSKNVTKNQWLHPVLHWTSFNFFNSQEVRSMTMSKLQALITDRWDPQAAAAWKCLGPVGKSTAWVGSPLWIIRSSLFSSGRSGAQERQFSPDKKTPNHHRKSSKIITKIIVWNHIIIKSPKKYLQQHHKSHWTKHQNSPNISIHPSFQPQARPPPFPGIPEPP